MKKARNFIQTTLSYIVREISDKYRDISYASIKIPFGANRNIEISSSNTDSDESDYICNELSGAWNQNCLQISYENSRKLLTHEQQSRPYVEHGKLYFVKFGTEKIKELSH